MPREGIERLTIKLKGGEKQLGRRVVEGWELGSTDTFTQRIFLASPRGSYLAWADARGALHLRDKNGRERVIAGVGGRDARFSADERYLATSKSDGTAAGFDILVIDTATGARRTIGNTGRPEWMEWVVDGVVVSQVVSGDEIAITYLPLEGEPVQVASGKPADLATRFTTARLGHRAMYFFQKRAFVVDVRAQEADAREVATFENSVDNAEMAPDGSEAVMVVAARGIYRWQDGRELSQIDPDPAAHTVWYSGDGSMLAWASLEKAVVLAGERRREMSSSRYELNALRFHGDKLVVSIDGKALLWDPQNDGRRVIGHSGKGRTMQAADLYQGGAVFWTREIRRTDRRRAAQQKNAAPEPFAMAD